MLPSSGQADTFQVAAFIRYGVRSYAEAVDVLEHAERHGVRMNTGCINMLLMQMQLDGRADQQDLEAAMTEAMAPRNLEPDERTVEIIHATGKEVSMMRTAQLERWLSHAVAGDRRAWASAWQWFSYMCEHRKVDEFQVRAMRPAARQLEQEVLAADMDEPLHDAQRHLSLYWAAEEEFYPKMRAL